MKRLLPALAFGLFAATAASAATTGITSSQVLTLFQSQGYTNIDISPTQNGQMKVEATQNGVHVEVIYDTATGQILNQVDTPEASSGSGLGGVTATGRTSGTNTGLSGENETETETESDGSNSGGSNSGGSSSGGDD